MLHKTGEDHREMRGTLGRGAPVTKLIFSAKYQFILDAVGHHAHDFIFIFGIPFQPTSSIS